MLYCLVVWFLTNPYTNIRNRFYGFCVDFMDRPCVLHSSTLHITNNAECGDFENHFCSAKMGLYTTTTHKSVELALWLKSLRQSVMRAWLGDTNIVFIGLCSRCNTSNEVATWIVNIIQWSCSWPLVVYWVFIYGAITVMSYTCLYCGDDVPILVVQYA